MLARVIDELKRPVEIRIVNHATIERDPVPKTPRRPADDRGARDARQSRVRERRMTPAPRFRPCAPGQQRKHRGHFPHVQAMLGRARKGAHNGAVRTAGEHGDNGNAAIEIVDLSNVAHVSEVRKCEAESQRRPR